MYFINIVYVSLPFSEGKKHLFYNWEYVELMFITIYNQLSFRPG